jgi:hypothetical protein
LFRARSASVDQLEDESSWLPLSTMHGKVVARPLSFKRGLLAWPGQTSPGVLPSLEVSAIHAAVPQDFVHQFDA